MCTGRLSCSQAVTSAASQTSLPGWLDALDALEALEALGSESDGAGTQAAVSVINVR